ncbi:MAG: methionine adenosyltransferase, partial [Rhodobacteraceae bacterium]|nr:methionine adenosyltransferase [Paracoccaceae bacterium]
MAERERLFTSESVSEGHPDKVCDQISDAVLDAYLAEDPQARVACETLATTNFVAVAGEMRGPTRLNDQVESIVRECVRKIGYEQGGFHWKHLKVLNLLHQQSADIAQGVDADGAGDQGLMFGFAVNESSDFMPAPLHYAHQILLKLSQARREGREQRLGPDAKSQITMRYRGGKPTEVTSIVLSAQHYDERLTSEDVRAIVEPTIRQTLPPEWITA